MGRCVGRWEVRCSVVESRDARFLVLKWVQGCTGLTAVWAIERSIRCVRPIGSDGPVRRAFGGVRRSGLQVKVCARKSTGFACKKRSLNCRVPHLYARMYCLAKWARIFGGPTVGEEGAYSLRRDSLYKIS